MQTLKSGLSALVVMFVAATQALAADAPAYIMTSSDVFRGFISNATKRDILWRDNLKSTVFKKQRITGTNIYFLEPESFTEALQLFKNREYQEARAKFKECASEFRKLRELKGNFSTLAAFYEMECARKMEDLAGLAALNEKFNGDMLVHNFDKVQIRVNSIIWEAVRTKSWARLDAIVQDDEWVDLKLPGHIRTQIAYAHGLALEGMGRPVEALNAYNTAFIADLAASEIITKQAALSSLRILADHEAVKLTMSLYKTEDYSDNSRGAFLIKEGTALLTLWDKVLGAGQKVPERYKVFLKFPPKNTQ